MTFRVEGWAGSGGTLGEWATSLLGEHTQAKSQYSQIQYTIYSNIYWLTEADLFKHTNTGYSDNKNVVSSLTHLDLAITPNQQTEPVWECVHAHMYPQLFSSFNPSQRSAAWLSGRRYSVFTSMSESLSVQILLRDFAICSECIFFFFYY